MFSWLLICAILILFCALMSALAVAMGLASNSLLLYLCKSVTKTQSEADDLANIAGFVIISVAVCIPLYSLTGMIGPAIFLVLFATYRQRSG